MTFVGEVDILSYSLPSACELLRVFLSKGSRELGFASTVVFTIAEEVDDECDELLTGLMIKVSLLEFGDYFK